VELDVIATTQDTRDATAAERPKSAKRSIGIQIQVSGCIEDSERIRVSNGIAGCAGRTD
jgi:hypothetical protein